MTTIKRADGQWVALDVRPIPPTARLGLSPFDLQPEATMTNATLEGQVVSAGGTELAVNPGGNQVITGSPKRRNASATILPE